MVCLHTWFKFLVFRPGVDCTLTVFLRVVYFHHTHLVWMKCHQTRQRTNPHYKADRSTGHKDERATCVCVCSSPVTSENNKIIKVVNLKPNWADNKQILQYLCLVFNPFINVEYDVSVKQFTATLVNHRPDVCVLEPLTQTHWFKSTRLHRPCTNIKEVHVHTDGLLTVRSLHRWHPQTYLSTS